MTEPTKVCSKCGEEKALLAFPRRYDRPCGIGPACKTCRNAQINGGQNSAERKRRWKEVNSAHVLTQAAEYRKANADRLNKYGRNHAKERYAADPQKFRDRAKAYVESNRADVLKRRMRYRSENAQGIAEDNKMRRDELRDSYVATTLRMRTEDVPPELIAMKREQLLIHRALKQFNQAINEVTNKGEST